jgi:DNA-binding GntR family transcriptional regulator
MMSDGRESATDEAYRKLRRLIVTGVLQPGEVISEQELVKRLQIGRTPVREAIQRLAWQGVLIVFPRRGVAVAKLGLEDVQAIFEARETIEAKLAELAASRCTDEDAQHLKRLGEQVKRAAQSEDFLAFLEQDQELHHAIAKIAKNHILEEYADLLLMLSGWVWHQYFKRHGSHPSDYFRHDEIIEAIVNREAAQAREKMAEHTRASRDLVRRAL